MKTMPWKSINKTSPRFYVKAYSLTEILIVLCIIGILLLMVLPNQTSVISQAKAIEAQAMLNQVYGLEKSHFYRFSKYSNNLEEIGFEQEQTVEDGVSGVDNDNKNIAPMIELNFDGNEKMQKFSFSIKFNDKNQFDKVILNSGKEFGIEEWNKFFTDMNPQDTEAGTNIQNDYIQRDYNNNNPK